MEIFFRCLFRYHAIVHPLNSLVVQSKRRTCKVIALTWLLPIFICLPNITHKSYAVRMYSRLGRVERWVCQDGFDAVDAFLGHDEGSFRRAYITLLFVVIYFAPMLVIGVTCVRIAVRLLTQPRHEREDSDYSKSLKKRREQNKRRVRSHWSNLLLCILIIAFRSRRSRA